MSGYPLSGGEKDDDQSSAITLVDHDEQPEAYVDLEGNKNEAEGAQVAKSSSSRVGLAVWIIVNIVATISIVFTNKSIFSTPSFRNCQLSFASFHFIVTFLTLHILSRPFIALFSPRRIRVKTMLPLAIAMCLNVLLMNLSLAYSSVAFYQIARVLLTPAVAAINYVFYRMEIPRAAVATFIPMCVGVATISYYEPKTTVAGTVTQSVDVIGVGLALTGVLVSSVYIVWISYYQRRLETSAFQLLHNQAPISGVLLLTIVPWVDSFPSISTVPSRMWGLILFSGACAVLINFSHFYITSGAGPVSSTVAGHLKTCSIVILGWITAGQQISEKSLFGVLLAVSGIFLYSTIMLRTKA